MAYDISTAIVGLVFLAAGALKAVDSASFVRQVGRFRLLPRRLEERAALLFIGFECALGAALLLAVSPWLIPPTALLLAGLAALTAWGAASGRLENCGCYGGQLLLTPAQSLALDGVYGLLLAVAWIARPDRPPPPAAWKLAAVAIVLVAALLAAARSRRTPVLDLALLRIGRAWRRRWLKAEPRDLSRGSHFVVFLSRDCPYCKRWVPLLNVIEVQQDLPSVVGVMSLDGASLDAFLREHVIRFPVAHMPQSLVSLMVNAYPTAALVEDGRIVSKWVGEMPTAYVDRIREFLEAVAPASRQAGGAFAG
jgi:hypothetical protein